MSEPYEYLLFHVTFVLDEESHQSMNHHHWRETGLEEKNLLGLHVAMQIDDNRIIRRVDWIYSINVRRVLPFAITLRNKNI